MTVRPFCPPLSTCRRLEALHRPAAGRIHPQRTRGRPTGPHLLTCRRLGPTRLLAHRRPQPTQLHRMHRHRSSRPPSALLSVALVFPLPGPGPAPCPQQAARSPLHAAAPWGGRSGRACCSTPRPRTPPPCHLRPRTSITACPTELRHHTLQATTRRPGGRAPSLHLRPRPAPPLRPRCMVPLAGACLLAAHPWVLPTDRRTLRSAKGPHAQPAAMDGRSCPLGNWLVRHRRQPTLRQGRLGPACPASRLSAPPWCRPCPCRPRRQGRARHSSTTTRCSSSSNRQAPPRPWARAIVWGRMAAWPRRWRTREVRRCTARHSAAAAAATRERLRLRALLRPAMGTTRPLGPTTARHRAATRLHTTRQVTTTLLRRPLGTACGGHPRLDGRHRRCQGPPWHPVTAAPQRRIQARTVAAAGPRRGGPLSTAACRVRAHVGMGHLAARKQYTAREAWPLRRECLHPRIRLTRTVPVFPDGERIGYSL